MQNIEYSDLYKFLVSVGIILVGIAMLIPYFYLKEDFGLYIPTIELARYSPEIQTIIHRKQTLLLGIQGFIPYISLVMVVAGIVSIIVGLCKWKGRQKQCDTRFDREIERLNMEIKSLTPKETKAKIAREVDEIKKKEDSQAGEPEKISSFGLSNFERTTYINDYFSVEREITDSFVKYMTTNYEVRPQARIENKFIADILLISRNNKHVDLVVEIKYFRNKLSGKYVGGIIQYLNTQIGYYQGITGRKAEPLLLVVYDREQNKGEESARFLQKTNSTAEYLPDMNNLKVGMIERQKVLTFDPRHLLSEYCHAAKS